MSDLCLYLKPVLLGEFQSKVFQSYFSEDINLPQTTGGTAVTNLVLARLNCGLAVDVITLDPNATFPIQRFRSKLLNLWVVKRRMCRCIRDGYREERILISQALTESDAYICHAHWTYEYGLFAVTQRIKPYVITVHDHSWNILRWVGVPYIGQYLITQYVLRRARGRLTAVSPYVADYVSHVTKVGTPVVPNLILVDSMQTEPLTTSSREPTTILTVADSGRLKNIKRAIRAFQQMRENRLDMQYMLIGAGLDSDGEIARWAQSKGLIQCVVFAGWMPHGQVLERMRSAAVIFHPSLEESFGNPVAESMALGIPVIGASDAGGVRWLLNDECGWLVRGRSVSELASALSEATSSRDLAQQKCKIANQRIKTICNPNGILEKYEQVYEKAIGVRSKRIIGAM